MVPVPYTVTANLDESIGVSGNVFFGGVPAFTLNKSTVPRVRGDEAGTGRGVKSGGHMGKVEPIEGNSKVLVNGNPVVRHGDRCKMNDGNTIRNMKGVEAYAEALGKQGIDVTTFSGSYISNTAHREFKLLADQYDGNIPDEVLVKTQIHAENRAWIEDLLSKGGSVVDIGNPFSAEKSVFYEMEQLMVFGGPK